MMVFFSMMWEHFTCCCNAEQELDEPLCAAQSSSILDARRYTATHAGGCCSVFFLQDCSNTSSHEQNAKLLVLCNLYNRCLSSCNKTWVAVVINGFATLHGPTNFKHSNQSLAETVIIATFFIESSANIKQPSNWYS